MIAKRTKLAIKIPVYKSESKAHGQIKPIFDAFSYENFL